MKFYVHFSTIQPRFENLSFVIQSWLEQTVSITNIIITTSKADNRLNEYKNKYNSVIIQTLNCDYGPNNKILGALKFYETLSFEDKADSYFIICDDDCKYDSNTAKSYLESVKYNSNFIYTHFLSVIRVKHIYHLQGADTYLLNKLFFQKTDFSKYEEYLKQTIKECPEALYQDDYVISYFIYIYCGLHIRSVQNRLMYNSTPNSDISQLNRDPRVRERERVTIEYFSKKIT